ncbi:hypothetical protein C5167_038496 [Papaver somniferum]|uniref:Uncharacterized protein n=1 Tax=Papaver somniferum TaxID=3469 RepID=A0A4Y7ID12_PAPSO|nr:hypothetical protein C5167_038496 [Papaver somniferum]
MATITITTSLPPPSPPPSPPPPPRSNHHHVKDKEKLEIFIVDVVGGCRLWDEQGMYPSF